MKKFSCLLILTIMLFLPCMVMAEEKCKSDYTQVGNMCQKVTKAYQKNGSYYCAPDAGVFDSVSKTCTLSYILENTEVDKDACESGYISDGEKCHKIISQASNREGVFYCDNPNHMLVGQACVEKEGEIDSRQSKQNNNKNDSNNDSNDNSADDDSDNDNGFWGTQEVVKCGSTDLPKMVPELTNAIVDLIKVATPIVLIILGMVDMLKATISNDEKGMSEAKTKLFKRCLAGALVFLVIMVVEFLVGIVASNIEERDSIFKCIDCMIDNADNCGK